MRRGGKYGVAPVEERTCEGIVFHSKREMIAYQGFRILEKSGQIAKLERQVPYDLWAWYPDQQGVVFSSVAQYICDFRVTELDGTVRLYETKGVSTAVYKLKKKIFCANYPHLRIVEI